MTQMNKTPKKFGIKLACSMAADCIRDNYAPVSVVLSNLISLQKDSVFPKELTKEFFKRPTQLAPADVQNIRSLMDALRSPHNGIANLLEEKMSPGWTFKKAPPADLTKQAIKKPRKTYNNKPKTYNNKSENVAPKIVVKKQSNI